MYNIDCPNDQKLDSWAKVELASLMNEMPIVDSFLELYRIWVAAKKWDVGGG